MLAFDSNLAPIVGQQVTLTGGTPAAELLVGKKMLIKDNLDNDESRRTIVVQSKDAGHHDSRTGGADDPRCGSDPPGTVKAQLTVASATSRAVAHLRLWCATTGRRSVRAAAPTGYKYQRSRARRRHGEDADLEGAASCSRRCSRERARRP